MTVKTWPEAERREQFEADVAALFEKYPELSQRMLNRYLADPTSSEWGHGDDCDCTSEFNPDDPMYLDGWVIVASIANLSGWHDLQVLVPNNQNPFITIGLLKEASR